MWGWFVLGAFIQVGAGYTGAWSVGGRGGIFGPIEGRHFASWGGWAGDLVSVRMFGVGVRALVQFVLLENTFMAPFA